MLADGYKEGKKGKIPAIDCALFLSKIIYHDLAVANASAWQLWNSWEPGNPDFDTRYYLLALKSNAANTEGDFTITKNLWALGHFSRFIRPGMKRIVVGRSDGLDNIKAAQDVMVSAFTDKKELVVVAINYTESIREITMHLPGFKKVKVIKQYVTSANPDENLKFSTIKTVGNIKIKPRSIVTFVISR